MNKKTKRDAGYRRSIPPLFGETVSCEKQGACSLPPQRASIIDLFKTEKLFFEFFATKKNL
ncbi:MAG: hypothetical protein LBB79_06880 [Prevotellaceae bacterium]|jgi:hypothetical protein|nr:hypothetical protein [Prevotellaceae bacterium]